MNKLSPRNLVVAAALFGIAAESAWAEEATSNVPAAPAEQTASSVAGAVPEHAPATYPRGYEQRWQTPPWPEPPPGYYGHFRPYYPPYPQYRAAPAENPLSAELKQTQEQLAAKTSELNTAEEQLAATTARLSTSDKQLATKASDLATIKEQLATLQAEQQAIREAIKQAQAETAKAGEQLSIVLEEMDILSNVLTELKARIDVQNTSLLGALEAGAEDETVESAGASNAEQVQAPATKPAQPGNAGSEQTESGDNERTKPEAGQEI